MKQTFQHLSIGKEYKGMSMTGSVPTLTANFYVCPHCKNAFSSRQQAQQHMYLCNFVPNTTPSLDQMYELMRAMGRHIQRLENRLHLMSQQMVLRKSHTKAAVLQWLHTTRRPTVRVRPLISDMRVSSEDIGPLMETPIPRNAFYLVLAQLLSKNVFDTLDAEQLPIYVPTTTSGRKLVFIYDVPYDTTIDSPEPIWREAIGSDFAILLNMIHIKMSSAMRQWQRENDDILANNDRAMLNYYASSNYLMNISVQSATVHQRVRTLLHDYISLDVHL